MKILSLIASLLLFFTIAKAQSDHEKDSLNFITSYTVTKQQIQTISFEASLDRKKALSAILGKTRHFKVHAVRNPYNKGYHFDWQISETNNKIENKTFLFKENDFFEIQERDRQINVLENIDMLDAQNELEIIRSYLLPNELLYGLLDSKQPIQCTFEDDDEHFKMYNQETNDLLRIVCYNKKTLFPENTDIIKSYPNMTALDITSVRLTDIKINEELPDEVLSMEHYLNQGYKVNLLNTTKPTDVAVVETPLTASPTTKVQTQNQVQPKKQIQPQTPVPTQVQAQGSDQVATLSQKTVNVVLKTDLETGKGWETTIAQFHDKSFLLIDFWYASSATSMQDLPTVQSLHRDFRKKGLRVFGVNCQDFNQKKTVVKNLKQKGITFTTLFGRQSKMRKWDIQNIPTYVLLDSEGQILLQGGSEILGEIRGYLNSVN